MPAVSLETATRLLQIAFLAGAITDGLALVPMIFPRAGAALFGGDPSLRTSASHRYAMGIGASLMAGWTALLLWGALDPIARRDVLLLTVFPVIAGIVLATATAVRGRILAASRLVPLWVHLGALSLYYAICYWLSGPWAGS